MIFTSDNGGERFSYNWPFRGAKGELYEGGIRVPAIVRWPGMSNVQGPTTNVGMRSQGMLSQEGGLPPIIGNRQSPIGNPSGRIIQDVAITMDWTATILAAAGVKADPNYPLDGIDLTPIITAASPRHPISASAPSRNTELETRNLFWRTKDHLAALKGRWKYLNDGNKEYLFDLSIDEREQADFRTQNEAMFAQLRDEFKKWESTVLPRPPARRRS